MAALHDPLPFAVLYRPEPEPYPVAVRGVPGVTTPAPGRLVGTNWLGANQLTHVVQFATGLELCCPPATVFRVAAGPSADVVSLADWRRSC